MTEPADFVQVVEAMAPYLDQLVFVGAWSHRLLRLHPLATPPSFDPLMTEDADVAVPERMRSITPSLHTALENGGFVARHSGDGPLPLSRYHRDPGFYVEFIAPRRGSGHTRKGDVDDILDISGITAQKLRYVDLLLFEPWELRLTRDAGFAVDAELTIRVANPASYLAQKVLTLNRRSDRSKRFKDLLYLHDTLSMFGASFDALRELAARVLLQLPAKTAREFHQLRVHLFDDLSLLANAAASARASGRANPPSAETIAALCTAGLKALFDSPTDL